MKPSCLAIAAAASLVYATLPSTAAAAGKACPRESDRTQYADPAVHAYVERRKARGRRPFTVLVACSRATGKRTDVAAGFEEDHEQSSVSVYGVLGGRYLWTSEYFTAAESFDVERHQLTDVETGKRAVQEQGGDFGADDVMAVPGALIAADGVSLIAKRPGGGRSVLDSGQVSAPALSGSTLYWQNGAEVRSAVAPPALPASEPRPPRPARRRSACVPKGRFTVLHLERVVVTRTRGGRLAGCLGAGRQRPLAVPVGDATPTGPATGLRIADGTEHLVYRLPVQTASGPATAAVVRNLATGAIVRSAVAAGITEAVASRRGLLYTDGTALTFVDKAGTRELARGAISGLALVSSAGTESRTFAYWTDGGVPKALLLDPPAPSPAG